VKLAGVCSGLAEHFDVDPTAVRLVWAVLTIFPGAIVCGVIAYVVAWLIIPVSTAPSAPLAAPPPPSAPPTPAETANQTT
jgi:phage shock protein PspC (stress-responsive transcriptional regulator)